MWFEFGMAVAGALFAALGGFAAVFAYKSWRLAVGMMSPQGTLPVVILWGALTVVAGVHAGISLWLAAYSGPIVTVPMSVGYLNVAAGLVTCGVLAGLAFALSRRAR